MTNIIYFILLILLIFILLIIYFNFCNKKFFNTNKEKFETIIKNPYIKDEHKGIIWQSLESEFMKNNWPNTFDFDYNIKEDIINRALLLPLNSCIIDCGAHIGDGAIAIAHALKYNERNDIKIYAIDPSKHKCDFIELIKNKNKLNNINVLNYGLSNINSTYNSIPFNGHNTGGTNWTTKKQENTESSNFIKLDDLVRDNIIKENIEILHLDVEGMEKEALLGAVNTIKKYKPYISVENNYKTGKDINGNNNSDNKEYFLNYLPEGYRYICNKDNNNIIEYFNF